jgi:hypothetical protein
MAEPQLKCPVEKQVVFGILSIGLSDPDSMKIDPKHCIYRNYFSHTVRILFFNSRPYGFK